MQSKTLQLFKSINSLNDFLKFQEYLISRIIHAESMIRKRKIYIKKVKRKKFEISYQANKDIDLIKKYDRTIDQLESSRRSYEFKIEVSKFFGDSLAFLVYPKSSIKLLCKNEDSGHLGGKEGLELELSVVRSAIQDGMLAILHDVTNCLKIGDVTIANPKLGNVIIECKTTVSEEFKITDRVIRQMERMEYATDIINNIDAGYDEKALKGVEKYDMPNGFIEIRRNETLLLQEFVDACSMNNDPYKIIHPETGLVYIAVNAVSYEVSLEEIKNKFSKGYWITGNILRRINGDFPYITPFTLFDLPDDLVIKILNCDLIFYVLIDAEYVVDQLEKEGYKSTLIINEQNDFVGLEIEERGRDLGESFLGPRFLQEVFYQFMSLNSAIISMIEFLKNIEDKLRE